MSTPTYPKHKKKDADTYLKHGWWTGVTLGDVIDKTADVFPNKEAVIDDIVRLTFSELRANVDKLALGLLDIGIKKGDAVLLQLPNWAEYVYSYFAMQKIGAIPVILISGYKQLEVGHLAKLTQAKAWIVPEKYRKIDYTSFMGEVRAANPQLKNMIFVRSDNKGGGDVINFESLLDREVSSKDKKRLELAKPLPTDVCHVVPSGGTTGLPKGIPRTHNDYICNVEYLHKGWEMNTTDACLVIVPVGHNLAVLNVVGSLLFAYKLVLSDSTRPADICKMIQDEKVTYMPSVPSLVRRIMEAPEMGDFDLTSLKKISAGGEPSTPDLIMEVYRKLHCTYINEFGMTEGLLCRSTLTDDIETICTTVGKATCPYDEVRIIDRDGKKVPAGVDGELAAKGPGIFAGYLLAPEAKDSSFTKDGFFRTGDQAQIDVSGYIKITGRIKDIIIRGGENISPAQVEEILCSHKEIADAAVIGMPDKDLGERVCAFVRLVPGAKLTPEAIVEYMEASGASKLLVPERFEFVDSLPMTQAGKHDKKVLKKELIARLGL